MFQLTNNNFKDSFIKLSIFFYIFSLFYNSDTLYFVFYNLQFSEIIFIIFFTFYFYLNFKKIISRINKIDLIVFGWPLINLITTLINYQTIENYTGIYFSIYVFFIYFLFKNLYLDFGYRFFINFLIIVLVFNSILSIIGWTLGQLGYETILIKYYVDYPLSILKEYRSSGFLPSPNFLFFLLSIGLFLIIKHNFLYKNIIIFLISLGIFFTFSINIFLLCALIFLPNLFENKNKYAKKFLFYYLLFIFIFFNFFANFIILPKKINLLDGIKKSYKNNNFYINKNRAYPLYENENLEIYPSIYFDLKKKGLDIFRENIFFGVGNNEYQKKLNDKYPALKSGKPHSTLFGILVSNGLIGLIYWIILSFLIFKKNIAKKEFNLVFLFLFLIYLSLNLDIHYFRMIWVILPMFLIDKSFFHKVKKT